jgi:hypothetical protein
MSVRFSLRFAGRSPSRLLGVTTCEEPGRESVVAIIGVCACASSGSSYAPSNNDGTAQSRVNSPNAVGRRLLTLTLI